MTSEATVTPMECADLMKFRQALVELSHCSAVEACIPQELIDPIIVALTAGIAVLEVK